MNYLHLLTILFVGLKLTHFIDWSWWAVILPSCLSVGLVIGLIVLDVWARWDD